MRRRPCASVSDEGVYGGLLAKESHIVEIARSGEVEDQVDGTTGRLIVDACVEKREQDVTDFLMSERRDFRDVFVDLFGRALAFAGDHFFDDFGMKREVDVDEVRSEEHTSELQSLMRISYAVFCLKKKNKQKKQNDPEHNSNL